MRFHRYNNFLKTQLSYQDVKNILGDEDTKSLIDHFGNMPAVFEADAELNKTAYDMAMNSRFVCKQGDTYDVIVYTCDGKMPYRKGNYFTVEDRRYLAYKEIITDFEGLTDMTTLVNVLANEKQKSNTEENDFEERERGFSDD